MMTTTATVSNSISKLVPSFDERLREVLKHHSKYITSNKKSQIQL